MRTDLDILETMKTEPLDFATINFNNPEIRKKYRDFELIALQHIEERECIFCFNKAYENDLGMLSELARIGYCHSECIEAFYELGFNFKLIGYIPQIREYAWEIVN